MHDAARKLQEAYEEKVSQLQHHMGAVELKVSQLTDALQGRDADVSGTQQDLQQARETAASIAEQLIRKEAELKEHKVLCVLGSMR